MVVQTIKEPKRVRKIASGIYVIRNIVTGRVYVGSSQHVVYRCNAHKRRMALGTHPNRFLQHAWDKHHAESFVFETLELVESVSELFQREQHWIDLLGAHVRKGGYNIHPSADGPRGHKQTPEVVERAAAARRGKKRGPLSAEWKANMATSARQRAPISEETRAKLVAIQKARPRNSERHRKMLIARNKSAKMRKAASLSMLRRLARLYYIADPRQSTLAL